MSRRGTLLLALVLWAGWAISCHAAYPFADDMESGLGNWTADPPWALMEGEGAHSPTRCVTDSPDGYYGNEADVCLTLAEAVDLAGAERPVLKFWHKHRLEDDFDFGYLEISTDGGTSWAALRAYTGTTGGGLSPVWVREQVDLSGYVGQQVLVRFRLVTDKTVQEDGWYIDDVAIAEAPHPVTLADPTDPTAHSLTLSWSQNLDDDFVAYRIYRSTVPGVSWDDELVAEITDQAVTSFTDTGLSPRTTYYYRVFVLDADDIMSGSKEVSGTTATGAQLPLFSDFESGAEGWTLEGGWAVTGEEAHGGSFSLTDSPYAVYDDEEDASAQVEVDLGGARRPLLRFWTKYCLQKDHDYGLVEVSADGGNSWTCLLFLTGSSGDWRQCEADLSGWAGQLVLLRFRLVSDGDGVVADGWYIDDVEVVENEATCPFPFYEDFEAGTASWICSTWGRTASTPHGGSWCATDTPDTDRYLGWSSYEYLRLRLTLRGTLDLSSAAHPRLGFWWRGEAPDYFRVSISTDGGSTWRTAFECSYYWADQWTYQELDLTPYRSSQVVIRFEVKGYRYPETVDGVQLDDISIYEGPALARRLEISPRRASVVVGDTLQFTATGYDADGNPVELDPSGLSWSVRGPIGTIDEGGLFTATQPGIGAVVARYGSLRAISGIIEVVGPAGGVSQAEHGTIVGSQGDPPAEGTLFFRAWVLGRPEEVLTQDSPGCGYSQGCWQVNVGNFPTPWQPGDVLHVEFLDAARGEEATFEYTLQDGAQEHDVSLSPIAYEFRTTSTTNLNVFTLIKDCGASTAEELLQAIGPEAMELAYWDAERQAYVGHTRGSPLLNFEVYPGHPYFVTVTAPCTFVPTGDVPDPWPAFQLLTTGTTSVNMASPPLSLLRVRTADELARLVLDCTEVHRWDVDSQAYVGHTYGQPFDFEVDVRYPYFLAVAGTSTWQPAGAGLPRAAGGVPQNEGGHVYNQDGSVPPEGAIQLRAWVLGRPEEVLTQDSPGCGYSQGCWQVNVGNFPTPWQPGDVLHVEFVNLHNGQVGVLEFALENLGRYDHDVWLAPPPNPADLDGDGDVDGSDLQAFSAYYEAQDPCADLNGDGQVTIDDLAAFAQRFGGKP